MTAPLEELEGRLGYTFQDRSLLIRALTHASLAADRQAAANSGSPAGDNEQLEFVGDAVLGFLASEFVFRLSPESSEGDLSRLKAHLVNAARLHETALELELGSHLRLGKGEELSGGRKKKALLADAVEAILAAIYLDGGQELGLEACRSFLTRYVWNSIAIEDLSQPVIPIDSKSALQELAQAHGLPVPRYAIVNESGPEHAKRFTIEARVGKQHVAQADGTSKKTASQDAARILLDRLREQLGKPDAPGAAEEAEIAG
ncbi:MAG: ribonuclease III [Acidobacteria bacterium]|nr:ribonuclease III [Acidobacteriota bacterium]